METKQSIRKLVFQRRKEAQMTMIEEASHVICQKVIQMPAFQEASWIFAYMDFNKEVMTKEIIEAAWKSGKRVAVPRVEGKDMTYYEITSFDQLVPGYFQIPEPEGCEEAVCEEALLIVPGVAFDRARHRVGYGQGFYDRYLSKHQKHTTVAVAFEFQVMDEVPFEELDILPQTLVTEKEMIG